MKTLAETISGRTGIPAQWIYGQMAFETGNFSSRLFREQNNVGGLKSGNAFANFSSLQMSAEEMARVLSLPRYSAARHAHNLREYVAGLGAGGYYGKDDPNAYLRGVGHYAPLYFTGGPTHVTVQVTNPNASADDIARATQRKLEETEGKRTQRMLLQLQSAYR